MPALQVVIQSAVQKCFNLALKNGGLECKDGASSGNDNNGKSNGGTQGSSGGGANNENKKPCKEAWQTLLEEVQ